MRHLFRKISEKRIAIPPPGKSALTQISSLFGDFQPRRVILLGELFKMVNHGSKNCTPGRTEFMSLTHGPTAKVCDRFQFVNWDMLAAEDTEKCEHLVGILMVYHQFFDSAHYLIE